MRSAKDAGPGSMVRQTSLRGEASVDAEDLATTHVGVQEVVRILGVNQRAVRNLVARGRLETKRDGEGAAARLVVSLTSIEKLRSERQREKQRLEG